MPRLRGSTKVAKLDRDIEIQERQLRLKFLERQNARADGYVERGRHPYSGASHTSRALMDWFPFRGEPADELRDLPDLRIRSRDLYRNNTIASGAIKTKVSNVVGSGLKLQSTIDARSVGLSDDAAADWQNQTEILWNRWVEESDAGGQLDLYEQQELAYLSYLVSGDAFTLFPRIDRPFSEFSFRVQIIEADRICNANYSSDTVDIKSGIRIGPNENPVAYFLRTTKGGSNAFGSDEWTEIPAVGEKSGRRNVIHLFKPDRPGAHRGVPFISSVIPLLKQLGRYMDSETMATIVSSMYTIFVTSMNDDAIDNPFSHGERRERQYDLAPGMVNHLEPGEKIDIANPGRPNTAFEAFVQALMRQVGQATEIPYEILIKHYSSSYSASRGARIDAQRIFNIARHWFIRKWCQKIYSEWLFEMVVTGKINAPGYLDSPAIRHAFEKSLWVGDSMGLLDPMKETQAAVMRIDNLLGTYTSETANLNGGDFEKNTILRQKEEAMIKSAGLQKSASPAPQQSQENTDGTSTNQE